MTMQSKFEQGAYDALQRLVSDYEWFHTGVGILGNLMFFVGSVLFLFEPARTAGVWLFIVGSFGMLVGSLGEAVIKDYEGAA